MFVRSMNCVWLLFFTTQALRTAESISNTHNGPDLKAMVRKVIPVGLDGKIEIPAHIKHIKLDIGLSYSAPMSQHWLSRENDLLVFGFEPNPASVNALFHGPRRDKNYLDKKFIGKSFFLIPCALGLSSSTTIKFFVTANDCGCSSIYFPKDFPIERIIEVPIFSLSDFFDLFPFDAHPIIEYIKIDAQGSDLDIAKSAGHYLAERVIYITLEAENAQYEGTVNSHHDIDSYMRSIGFVPHISPHTSDPTYFNPRYSEYVKHHNVQIYQKG